MDAAGQTGYGDEAGGGGGVWRAGKSGFLHSSSRVSSMELDSGERHPGGAAEESWNAESIKKKQESSSSGGGAAAGTGTGSNVWNSSGVVCANGNGNGGGGCGDGGWMVKQAPPPADRMGEYSADEDKGKNNNSSNNNVNKEEGQNQNQKQSAAASRASNFNIQHQQQEEEQEQEEQEEQEQGVAGNNNIIVTNNNNNNNSNIHKNSDQAVLLPKEEGNGVESVVVVLEGGGGDAGKRLGHKSASNSKEIMKAEPRHHHHHKRDREGNLKLAAPGSATAEDEGGEDGGKGENGGEDPGSKGKDRSQDERDEENMEDAGQGERDKDAVVVQQRKRMSRQRAGCQQTSAARDARSRFRGKEREGWHGSRPESSAVTYKIGEGLPELTKLWKESASNSEAGTSGAAPTLEVRIMADLATTSNRQFRGSQLWGTDIYTDDSDLVAVLMHTGYYSPTPSPPSCISEIRATLRVLPPQKSYKSTLRNSVRSRAWGAASGCSYSIERCWIVKAGGGIVNLEPSLNRMPVVAPTLAPAAMERTMTTRSASSNAHRQQRFVQEVTIQYNLCNEPWLKYSMSIVADRGLKKSQYTSARLKRGDVLYLETHTHRYELSYDGDKTACNGTAATTTATSAAPADKGRDNNKSFNDKDKHNGGACDKNGQCGEYAEHYKWAVCNFPLPLSVVRAKGVPLPSDLVQVLEDGLTWDEVQWSPTSVWIRGKEFLLARAQFLSSNVDVLAP